MTAELPKLPADLTPRDRDIIDTTFTGMIEAFDSPDMRGKTWYGRDIADMIRLMQSIARRS